RQPTPFGNTGPALDAVVHGDLLGFGKALNVRERKLYRIVHEAANLQLVVKESIPGHELPIVAFGHFAIGPKAWRDIRLGIMLARRETVECGQHQRVGDEFLYMLQKTRIYPRDIMRGYPRERDHSNANEAQDHSPVVQIVGAHHDVIHVANKAGHHDQRHMYDDEGKETEHREEVNRARGLPAAKHLRIPVEVIDCRRRHGDTGEDCRWAKNKDDGEIGDLLQRVVSVKSVELSWQVECRIVYPGV